MELQWPKLVQQSQQALWPGLVWLWRIVSRRSLHFVADISKDFKSKFNYTSKLLGIVATHPPPPPPRLEQLEHTPGNQQQVRAPSKLCREEPPGSDRVQRPSQAHFEVFDCAPDTRPHFPFSTFYTPLSTPLYTHFPHFQPPMHPEMRANFCKQKRKSIHATFCIFKLVKNPKKIFPPSTKFSFQLSRENFPISISTWHLPEAVGGGVRRGSAMPWRALTTTYK